jgi:hypothetical protein
MAKMSKKSLSEFDAALDQLGGGVAPIPRPSKRRRAVSKPRPVSKTAKTKSRARKRAKKR